MKRSIEEIKKEIDLLFAEYMELKKTNPCTCSAFELQYEGGCNCKANREHRKKIKEIKERINNLLLENMYGDNWKLYADRLK